MPRTDEVVGYALRYVGERLNDALVNISLQSALSSSPEIYDKKILLDYEYGKLAGSPLRRSLRITSVMFLVMLEVYQNHSTMGDEDGAQAAQAYNGHYEEVVEDYFYDDTLWEALTHNRCGETLGMVYSHPVHGVGDRMSQEEYRVRTSPYVVAFGEEVYPGDRVSGLIHTSAQRRLDEMVLVAA